MSYGIVVRSAGPGLALLRETPIVAAVPGARDGTFRFAPTHRYSATTLSRDNEPAGAE
jgi:hypothetical protein